MLFNSGFVKKPQICFAALVCERARVVALGPPPRAPRRAQPVACATAPTHTYVPMVVKDNGLRKRGCGVLTLCRVPRPHVIYCWRGEMYATLGVA